MIRAGFCPLSFYLIDFGMVEVPWFLFESKALGISGFYNFRSISTSKGLSPTQLHLFAATNKEQIIAEVSKVFVPVGNWLNEVHAMIQYHIISKQRHPFDVSGDLESISNLVKEHWKLLPPQKPDKSKLSQRDEAASNFRASLLSSSVFLSAERHRIVCVLIREKHFLSALPSTAVWKSVLFTSGPPPVAVSGFDLFFLLHRVVPCSRECDYLGPEKVWLNSYF